MRMISRSKTPMMKEFKVTGRATFGGVGPGSYGEGEIRVGSSQRGGPVLTTLSSTSTMVPPNGARDSGMEGVKATRTDSMMRRNAKGNA